MFSLRCFALLDLPRNKQPGAILSVDYTGYKLSAIFFSYFQQYNTNVDYGQEIMVFIKSTTDKQIYFL